MPEVNDAPALLAYCDTLFKPSESFVARGYSEFRDLRVVYVGHRVEGTVPEGAEVVLLSPLHGPLGTTGFRQAGVVSEKLLRTLKALNPVAIHASFGKSGTLALPLARRLCLPLAVTYYGADATKHANTKSSLLHVYNRRRAQLWREVDLMLPCSDFLRRELLAKGAPPDKMVVHHNSADPEVFQPGSKAPLLVFAGRWTEKKGIDTLIAALSDCRKKLDGWVVRLIGEGPLKPAFVAELASAGIDAELPGWVPADEMPQHWAEASIACVPSRRAESGDAEGLPLVCVEAMLSGCAVAATHHAGISECVLDGETGYLVEEGDSEALANRLKRMLREPEVTAAMGVAGRAHAIENFNLRKQSAKLEEHLLHMAAVHGSLPSSALQT